MPLLTLFCPFKRFQKEVHTYVRITINSFFLLSGKLDDIVLGYDSVEDYKVVFILLPVLYLPLFSFVGLVNINNT